MRYRDLASTIVSSMTSDKVGATRTVAHVRYLPAYLDTTPNVEPIRFTYSVMVSPLLCCGVIIHRIYCPLVIYLAHLIACLDDDLLALRSEGMMFYSFAYKLRTRMSCQAKHHHIKKCVANLRKRRETWLVMRKNVSRCRLLGCWCHVLGY